MAEFYGATETGQPLKFASTVENKTRDQQQQYYQFNTVSATPHNVKTLGGGSEEKYTLEKDISRSRSPFRAAASGIVENFKQSASTIRKQSLQSNFGRNGHAILREMKGLFKSSSR